MSAQSTPGPCAGERPTVNATCCERDCGYCATTKVRDSHYCDLHTPCACAECQRARHAEQQYRAPDLAAENEALRKALYTFAKRPCEYNSKRGAVCSMLPSPIAYCATCTARIAIGNDGLAAITTHPARGEEGAR